MQEKQIISGITFRKSEYKDFSSKYFFLISNKSAHSIKVCLIVSTTLHATQTGVNQLVSWCFKPSQPQRITSGLNTNFTITQSYFTSHHPSTSFHIHIHIHIFIQTSMTDPVDLQVFIQTSMTDRVDLQVFIQTSMTDPVDLYVFLQTSMTDHVDLQVFIQTSVSARARVQLFIQMSLTACVQTK